MQIIVNAVLT